MAYFKCPECELNYVKSEGELCPLCAKMKRTDGVFRPEIDYTSGCYSCKLPLTSKLHKFCPKCGWLICPSCGSCACK